MDGLTSRSRALHSGPAVTAPHFLYRCYDKDGDLIYIGCTNDVARRMSAHRSSRATASRWLSLFMARYEVEGPFDGREAGREAEHRAIQLEQPLFNYQCRNDVGIAAWMTRRPIAQYLVERGHIELAAETVCGCCHEAREAGLYDENCVAHVAAVANGLVDMERFDWDVYEATFGGAA